MIGSTGDTFPWLSKGRILQQYHNVSLKRDTLPWCSTAGIKLCLFAETNHDSGQFILDNLKRAIQWHWSGSNWNRDVTCLPHL